MIVTNFPKSPSLERDQILETKQELQKTIADTAQKIAEVYERTNSAYLKDQKIPNEGVQYPLPYLKILKEGKQTARFNWFRDRGSALRGYLKGFGYIEQDKLGFMILPKKKPSEVLDQALNKIALIACAEACQFAQWQGIRQVLGDEKFDALFGPTSSFKLMIAARRSDNPLNRLRIVTSIPNKQEIQLGDMVYIPNDPEYPKCDPFGPGTGYNAICIKQNQDDEPKFTIHGLNAKGATLDEVANDLYQELQKDPTILEKDELPEAAREDIRLLPKLKPKPKISFKEFTQRGGGALLQKMWIDPAKVTILKELSVENGMKMLSTWRPQIQL